MTKYVFFSRGIQKVGFHLRGHRAVRYSKPGYNRQLHRNVRSRHEQRASDHPAGPFEILAEWRQERAFSIAKGVELKPVIVSGTNLRQKLAQFGLSDGERQTLGLQLPLREVKRRRPLQLRLAHVGRPAFIFSNGRKDVANVGGVASS